MWSASFATYLVAGLLCLSVILPQNAHAKKCLFISSYHQGYAWSDGVERGLRSVLEGKCDLKQYDMDTKRHKGLEYKQAKGLEAKELIDSWQPDVVVTADDNAAKYVIQMHYKDTATPFVFCGINWTVKEYGFPYSNVTGMIEIAPIEPLLDKVRALLPNYERAIYIGANTHTETKNLARFEKAAVKNRIQLDSRLVDTAEEWLVAYRDAQKYDFIIMGSNSGIKGWDQELIVTAILPETRRLSITSHGWMMPYTMLGYTKVPEEQGEWAGMAALDILGGVKPSEIVVVPNRKWDIWTNNSLLDAGRIALPKNLLTKSKKIN
ncbi:MAG: ABC transporter substrate binding protein [Pseudomonadota bacterium]